MAAYITVEQLRARLDLGLSDETIYPDAVLEMLIRKASVIINAYLRQSILLNEVIEGEGEEEDNPNWETAIVNAVPTAFGGLHVQLPRRYVVEVKDNELVVKYGYGISNLTINSTQYQLNKELGYFDTVSGAIPHRFFDEPSPLNFQVEVSYRAGFAADALPEDFLEALYAIIGKLKEALDASGSGDTETSFVSNKIKEYKTLNEQIKFAENVLNQTTGAKVLEDWVENILLKYRMPDFGIGIRF